MAQSDVAVPLPRGGQNLSSALPERRGTTDGAREKGERRLAYGLVLLGAVATVAVAVIAPVGPRMALSVGGREDVALGLAAWVLVTLFTSAASTAVQAGLVIMPAFAPILAATVLGGPTAGALVAWIGTLEGRELRGQVPLWGVFGSHAQVAVAAIGSGLVALAARTWMDRVAPGASLEADLVAVLAAGVTFRIIDAVESAAVVAPRTGSPLGRTIGRQLVVRPAWLASMIALAFLLAESYVHLAPWVVLLALVPTIASAESLKGAADHWLAEHDPLTGLATRRAFESRLALASGDRSGRSPAGLILVDLDGFKEINDSYGHPVGDEVLRVTAQRLTASVRGNDLAARLGGDEFGVILAVVPDESALRARAEAVRAVLAEPMRIEAGELTVGASVGCATFGGRHGRADQAYERADRALYGAKVTGIVTVAESLGGG